jgi:hypothetical protein
LVPFFSKISTQMCFGHIDGLFNNPAYTMYILV